MKLNSVTIGIALGIAASALMLLASGLTPNRIQWKWRAWTMGPAHPVLHLRDTDYLRFRAQYPGGATRQLLLYIEPEASRRAWNTVDGCFEHPLDLPFQRTPRERNFPRLQLATVGEVTITKVPALQGKPAPPTYLPAWFIEIQLRDLNEVLEQIEMMPREAVPLPRPRPKDLGKKKKK